LIQNAIIAPLAPQVSEEYIHKEHTMKKMINLVWKIIRAGAWLPVVVFGTHLLMSRVFHTYAAWPDVDIIMHFAGGFAIAFFVSGCFRALPRGEVNRSRIVLLELLLIGSLTATIAVFWEFREFANDQIFGTNSQVSLANTMQDLAVGIMGSGLFILIRAWQLRAGFRELRELTFDWVRGEMV
jgi:hypothetical protein